MAVHRNYASILKAELIAIQGRTIGLLIIAVKIRVVGLKDPTKDGKRITEIALERV